MTETVEFLNFVLFASFVVRIPDRSRKRPWPGASLAAYRLFLAIPRRGILAGTRDEMRFAGSNK